MCLVQFSNINDSLQALGLLQNESLGKGRRIRMAFTRSKISSNNNVKEEIQNEMFEIAEEGMSSVEQWTCK
jgi:hypothetical protein